MRSPGITPAEYQELIDGDDWSPMSRAMFEQQKARVEKREALRAATSEQARREALTYKWQQETLRKLRLLNGLQFEIAAWRRLERLPWGFDDNAAKARTELRGVKERLDRARREADAGCVPQTQWLAHHAALIAAVEAQTA